MILTFFLHVISVYYRCWWSIMPLAHDPEWDKVDSVALTTTTNTDYLWYIPFESLSQSTKDELTQLLNEQIQADVLKTQRHIQALADWYNVPWAIWLYEEEAFPDYANPLSWCYEHDRLALGNCPTCKRAGPWGAICAFCVSAKYNKTFVPFRTGRTRNAIVNPVLVARLYIQGVQTDGTPTEESQEYIQNLLDWCGEDKIFDQDSPKLDVASLLNGRWAVYYGNKNRFNVDGEEHPVFLKDCLKYLDT